MVLSNTTEIFKSLQVVEISHVNEICFGPVLLAPYSTATRQISRITFSIPSNTYDEAFFDAFRDLVQFVRFKICEKHPCRSATFSKVAG